MTPTVSIFMLNLIYGIIHHVTERTKIRIKMLIKKTIPSMHISNHVREPSLINIPNHHRYKKKAPKKSPYI